jgi:hypothetical protein
MKLYGLILALLVAGAGFAALSAARRPGASAEAALQQASADGSMSADAAGHQHEAVHMRMTETRRPAPGDQLRADAVVSAARGALMKYQDHQAALRDGYRILSPDVPQTVYHFNHFGNAAEAERRFDPARPTSLLYEKAGEGYRLIGVMYTAPAGMSEAELNERIPLSVARWHQHVNICLPPGAGWEEGIFSGDGRFGLEGSISTPGACAQAGGEFVPRLFGWMLHLYPFETEGADAWSSGPQLTGGAGHRH